MQCMCPAVRWQSKKTADLPTLAGPSELAVPVHKKRHAQNIAATVDILVVMMDPFAGDSRMKL